MFGQTVFDQLVAGATAEKFSPCAITADEYREWERQYTFDGIRGMRYGQSFCEYFGVQDNLLLYSLTATDAALYIRKNYLA